MSYSISENEAEFRVANRKGTADLLAALHQHHDYRVLRPVVRAKAVPKPKPTQETVIPAEVLFMQQWAEINARKRFQLLRKLNTISEPKAPTMQEIIREVCIHFGVPRLGLLSVRRDRTVTIPRQIACYIAKDLTKLSMPAIGRFLGNRDHTTILSAIKRVELIIKEGSPLIADIEAIKEKLAGLIATRERADDETHTDLRDRISSEAALSAASDSALESLGITRKAALGAAE